MRKKCWEKPVLSILYRQSSEENVLESCKTPPPDEGLRGPTSWNRNCAFVYSPCAGYTYS